jgi:hypothetical protein
VLGVIIPAVERVLQEMNAATQNALTLSLDAGNRLVPRRGVTVEQADASAIAAALWEVFELTSEAYFRARQEVSEIERTLNSDLDILVPDAADVVRRAEVGIVLARMVGRADYDAIANAHIARINEFYRDDLQKLAARCKGDLHQGPFQT